jgi:hypothetical protein
VESLEGLREVTWIGSERGADKKIPQGKTLLLSKENWCDLKEIQGSDLDILYSPTIEKAFDSVLSHWTPKNKIAVVSLCTSTRPYSLSRKWSLFNLHLHHCADLIIQTNSGLIPLEYNDQFPYLNYDLRGPDAYLDYIDIGISRMKAFFSQKLYRYIVFNFRHNLSDVIIAKTVGPWLKEQGFILDYRILPTLSQYRISQKELFHKKGFSMYPELWPTMLNPFIEEVKNLHKECS